MIKIRKRDGVVVPFDKSKIFGAVGKAYNDYIPKDWYESSDAIKLAKRYEFVNDVSVKAAEIVESKTDAIIDVEDIQDIVVKCLEDKEPEVAKLYKNYRNKRTKARERHSSIMKTIGKISGEDSKLLNVKRDNANIDGDSAMGTMLQIGSESSKEYYLTSMISPDIAKAHIEGDIHIHDLDFYRLTETCCQIDLFKLFDGGFNTGHGHLREPQSIGTAAALAAIAIQANQNDQHGGQSIPNFDYVMAKYVKKSADKNFLLVTNLNPRLSYNDATEKAWQLTKEQTFQAMEGFISNLNSMHSRAGAQVPFSSINYGTDTSKEGRLVIEQLLLATEAGLGKGETPIFPIQIFRCKEGINLNEGEPNYDLFELACKVSEKRLFPNFSFIDAPYNLQYYKQGHPETEVAYMGAARGDETVSIKIGGNVMSDIKISEAYEQIKAQIKRPGHDGTKSELAAFKNKCGVYMLIHKPTGMYYIGSSTNIRRRLTEHRYTFAHSGNLGDNYHIGDYDVNNLEYRLLEECDIDELYKVESKYVDFKSKNELCVNQKDPINNGNYVGGSNPHSFKGEYVGSKYGKKWNGTRVDYLPDSSEIFIMSNGEWVPVRAILKNEKGCPLRMMKIVIEDGNAFNVTEDHPFETQHGRVQCIDLRIGDKLVDCSTGEHLNIESIEFTGEDCETYDFTTDNDMFNMSGIISHNCRTRVIGNVYDPDRQITYGRGNLSFTSINLPRLAIRASGNAPYFFRLLDEELELVARQLKERFEVQCKRHPKNYPFLMKQGVWIDSDKLGDNDDITEILKHGTLSIGFIGLAETLVALTGKHHGEDEESQRLGLQIVKYIRDFCDSKSKDTKMNWTCLATPAEGLAGRFVKIDQQRYGKIPGVTDKEYYTNSFHVPVSYKTTAFHKLEVEGPYHALTNAGHISYIEMDGDPTQNHQAFVKIVKAMRNANVGYGAINHPLDRCPKCGHSGIINDKCPVCGSDEIERLRRITGYLVGTLDRWNDGKKAEERDRVKHA